MEGFRRQSSAPASPHVPQGALEVSGDEIGLSTRRLLQAHAQSCPHLRQLVRTEFLASYTIAEAKGRTGFVLTFRPGAAFFALETARPGNSLRQANASRIIWRISSVVRANLSRARAV